MATPSLNIPTHVAGSGAPLYRGVVARTWSAVFAALYDPLNRAAEEAGVAAWRRELLAHASGSVLEIGPGTGANLEHYPDALERLILVEPDAAMRKRLEPRLRERDEVDLLDARADALPVPNASIDTVVTTYVLCSVDPGRALAEIRRVLRPEGQLLFCEHVRAASPGLARWQDRLNRPWRALACGCNCNRATEQALRDAAFEIVEIHHGGLDEEVALVRPTIRGRARPSGG